MWSSGMELFVMLFDNCNAVVYVAYAAILCRMTCNLVSIFCWRNELTTGGQANCSHRHQRIGGAVEGEVNSEQNVAPVVIEVDG